MQLANGSSAAGGAARGCRRTEDEVAVVCEMVFRVVNVVVLVFRVGEVDDDDDNDDNDDEAEAINAGTKQEENIVIMRMRISERISSPPFRFFFSVHKKSRWKEVYD